jgi:hypothetical protein
MISSGGERGGPVRVLVPFDPRPSAKLAQELINEAGVSCAVAGRLALWTYQKEHEQQLTKDLDLAVPLEEIGRLEQVARARGYDVQPLRIGGFAIRASEGLRIDFIDRRLHGVAPLYRDAVRAAKERKATVTIGDVTLPVVSPEYLLAMKLVSGEPKDDQDVRSLLRMGTLDYARARGIAAQFLGPLVADRLDALARDVGRPEVPPRGEYDS